MISAWLCSESACDFSVDACDSSVVMITDVTRGACESHTYRYITENVIHACESVTENNQQSLHVIDNSRLVDSNLNILFLVVSIYGCQRGYNQGVPVIPEWL